MALPFIQIYPGDFLVDTVHLRGHARNAYLMLLVLSWQHGSLPSDEEALAQMLALTVDEWREIAQPVLAFFERVDGRLTQKRLSKERKRVMEKIEARRRAGQKGGRAQALNRKQKFAQATLKQVESGSITDSPTGTESDKESPNRCSLDHEFAQIMTLYPRPTHRREGRMAYHQARTEGASFREIVAGIDRLKANLPSDPRYIPALPNWLLGERWKDEPMARPLAAERETPYQAAISKAKRDIEATYGKRDDSDYSNVIDLQAHSSA